MDIATADCECESNWRSPILSVVAETPADGSATTASCSVVQIPEEGWYAFCFGCSDLGNAAHDEKVAVEALLCIQTEKEGETTSTATSLELPLPSHHQNGWLRNINVGKQIFLTRGAKLTVVSVSTNQGQRKKSRSEWGVIFHHSFSSKQKQQQPMERPSVGTLANHKKSLVCRHCGRCFPSQHAALHHVESVHRSSSSNSNSNNETTTAQATKRQRNGGGSFDEFTVSIDNSHASPMEDESPSGTDNNDKNIWTSPLSLLFEDDFMAVIDKPQGMAVMGTRPCLLRCDLLMSLRCSKSNKNDDDIDNNRLPKDDEALRKPRPVHRLDAATGGVLVVAKTRRAETALRTSFELRQCHKRYRAIVLGKLEDSPSVLTSRGNDDRGVIDLPISGKPSQTLYRPVRYVQSVRDQGWLTLVDLWPITGRRHQLRKHMKGLGHPILGDRRHGNGKMVEQEPFTVAATSRRLCLWAMEITLSHPITGEERTFGLPQDPAWLEQVLQLEEHAWKQRHEPPLV